ncbi:hypothetical protein B0H11DRAFT_2185129 [Mycena galericulata]|nr:hypothetical protein B0H11DRAFT_2185129 [Mycena galericulata]
MSNAPRNPRRAPSVIEIDDEEAVPTRSSPPLPSDFPSTILRCDAPSESLSLHPSNPAPSSTSSRRAGTGIPRDQNLGSYIFDANSSSTLMDVDPVTYNRPDSRAPTYPADAPSGSVPTSMSTLMGDTGPSPFVVQTSSSFSVQPSSPFTVHPLSNVQRSPVHDNSISAHLQPPRNVRISEDQVSDGYVTFAHLEEWYEYRGLYSEGSLPGHGDFIVLRRLNRARKVASTDESVDTILFSNEPGEPVPGMAIAMAHGLPIIHRKPNLLKTLMQHTCDNSCDGDGFLLERTEFEPRYEPFLSRTLPVSVPDTAPTFQSADDLDVLPVSLSNETVVDTGDGTEFVSTYKLNRCFNYVGLVTDRTPETRMFGNLPWPPKDSTIFVAKKGARRRV